MSELIQTLQRELQQALREIDQLRHQLRQTAAESSRAREEAHRKIHEFAREVRVPLTSVLGFTDLLSVTHKGNPSELNQIAKAGHQLMQLVTKLEEADVLKASAQLDGGIEETVPSNEEFPATRTILHIEDNETNFRLIERILEDRANLKLLWAPTGEEGMVFARERAPALILLDLNLPDTHGSTVLQRLKDDPLTEPIPVIVLSADIGAGQIERMLQGGARNYLTKPFEIKRLLCLVDEGLASNEQAAVR